MTALALLRAVRARPLPREQVKVLRFLSASYSDWEGNCWPFKPIMKATRLPRPAVRKACRALARKGLTEFHSGLWSVCHDRPVGSGYCCTKAGADIIARLDEAIEREGK